MPIPLTHPYVQHSQEYIGVSGSATCGARQETGMVRASSTKFWREQEYLVPTKDIARFIARQLSPLRWGQDYQFFSVVVTD